MTRYASQTGCHVVRRFGWDCHGLPVEYEIDKKLGKPTAVGCSAIRRGGNVNAQAFTCAHVLGIKSRDDVLKFGIGNYNEECRSIVMRSVKQQIRPRALERLLVHDEHRVGW